MYHICTTERAAAQQLAFQQCLLEAMHSRPYHEITVTGLCEAANLSRKTFYRLYDNKDDVFCALIDQMLRKFESEKLPDRTFHDELRRMFLFWRSQEKLLDAVAKNHMMAMLTDRCLLYLSDEDPLAKYWLGVIDHPFSPEMMVYFVSGIMGLLIYWHHSGYRRSLDEMTQIAVILLTKPPLNLSKDML